MELGMVLAIAGAIIVMAISGTGSAIGVALAAQAAAGVITENPASFGKMLPIIGIPGTQGFYGFLIGFLVLNKLNLLGAAEAVKKVTVSQGWQIFAITVAVSIVECISAVHQGKVSVSSVGVLAKRPDELGKAMVLPVFVEIYAILGLAAGFLLLQAVKV